MEIAVVTGNPKPASRTLDAAKLLADRLGCPSPNVVIDVVDLGAGLLGWGDPAVAAAVEAVRASPVVIFASPTYKATYTGLLKLFLDQIPADGLTDVVALPLMLGAGPAHALAPELLLKPVLIELGATCPTRALYLMDSDYSNAAVLDPWVARAHPQIMACVRQEVR
jgi:FMN reductase